MNFAATPAVAELRSLLVYEPDTGIIRWAKRCGQSAKNRSISHINKTGYYAFTVCGKTRLVHRAAWALTHGEWPESMIDHINGDRLDNRLVNLRLCEHVQNCQNRTARISSNGFKGVTTLPNGKHQAQIKVYGTSRYLGCFDSAVDAALAYDIAAKSAFGTFASLNFPVQVAP